MSSPVFNARHHSPQAGDWAARLIPGAASQAEGLYRGDGAGELRRQIWTLGEAIAWGTVLMVVVYRLHGFSAIALAVVCGAGGLHFGMLLAWRWVEQRRVGREAQRGRGAKNVLVVGAGALGRRVVSHIQSHPEAARKVCGFLDDRRPLRDGVIGRVSNLPRLARTEFVDEIILAAPHDRELTLRVLQEARRLRLDVKLVPDLFGCEPVRKDGERIGGLPVICLHEERLPEAGLLMKRLLDGTVAAIALIAMSPLMVLIAALVKVDSRGSAIYAAQRVGRKGRAFRCYKFRTMVSNADDLKAGLNGHNQRCGPFFKIVNDPRITHVGRFLRRYSLDEIPQFWNVLKGEMSLVGPRPHPLEDFAVYEIEHLPRLDVTPGMTGLWQVTARREPSFEKGLALDLEYIRSWSLAMDFGFLFRTVATVLHGSGD